MINICTTVKKYFEPKVRPLAWWIPAFAGMTVLVAPVSLKAELIDSKTRDAEVLAKASRPNMIFALADDLGWGDLGVYGHPIIQTPNLDALAAEGMRFTHGYSPSSNCSPSRAAILTGRHPYRVGMYDFMRVTSPMHIPEDEISIANILQDDGYQTMFVGKWHLSGNMQDFTNPGDLGFDHWMGSVLNFGRDHNGFVLNGGSAGNRQGSQATMVIDEALDWLENIRDKSKPYLMFIWFNEPHTPVTPSQEYSDMYANIDAAVFNTIEYGGPAASRAGSDMSLRRDYYGSITEMDFEFGRLLDAVEDQGDKNNTLVMFTSDNGPEHRHVTSWGSPGYLRGAKGHQHEGGIRVPVIVRWPGHVTAGSVSAIPVNGTDVLPTFAALAGAPYNITKTVDGTDIMPAILYDQENPRPEPLFWWMFHARGGKKANMRIGDWKIIADINGSGTDMELIKNGNLVEYELHNLILDSAETTDVQNQNPTVYQAMKTRFDELYESIQDEGPVWSSIIGR